MWHGLRQARSEVDSPRTQHSRASRKQVAHRRLVHHNEVLLRRVLLRRVGARESDLGPELVRPCELDGLQTLAHHLRAAVGRTPREATANHELRMKAPHALYKARRVATQAPMHQEGGPPQGRDAPRWLLMLIQRTDLLRSRQGSNILPKQ